MAQDQDGVSRPVDLTDNQVEALAMGEALEVGEPTRPRSVTEEDVKALASGKDLNIENFPVLKRLSPAEERLVSAPVQSRPRNVSDAEVETLRKGGDVGLETKDSIKTQD